MKKLFAILLLMVVMVTCISCTNDEKSSTLDYGEWYSSIDWDEFNSYPDVIVEDIIVEDIIVEDIIVEDIID